MLHTGWKDGLTEIKKNTRNLLEHDQNTPGDSPLLRADQGPTLAGGCQLGDVHRNLGGANAHTETINDTTNEQHADCLAKRRRY